MAASKSVLSTGFSSTSIAAGATAVGGVMDYSTADGGLITIQVTTTTAPTSNGVITLAYATSTGAAFVPGPQISIAMAATANLSYVLEVPLGAIAVQIQITAGTGTGIVVSAQATSAVA